MMNKVFEFTDDSGYDCDDWWDEVYGDGENYHYSLVSVLDACVSLLDKEKLSQMPELPHLWWPDVGEYLFSEIDNLDIKSLEKPLLGMGYNITIDGVCIFSYDTQHQGYIKSVSGAYSPLPTLVNKYKSDKDFISKLGELLSDCGIEGEVMDSFINLIYIRGKDGGCDAILEQQIGCHSWVALHNTVKWVVMSVWSSFSGTVMVHKCRHISINKLLSSSWDEVIVGVNTIRQGEYFLHTIECRATVEGIYAHKWLEGIVKRFIKSLGKTPQDYNVLLGFDYREIGELNPDMPAYAAVGLFLECAEEEKWI